LYRFFVHVRHPDYRMVVKADAPSRTPTSAPEPVAPSGVLFHGKFEEETMGRGILLWLLGVPIPVIILLWLFFGH